MAASRAVHEVSPDGAGSPAEGASSATPILGFSPEGDQVLAEMQSQAERDLARGVGRMEPADDHARTCCPAGPTTGEDEDAGSSVSENTAVAIGHRADPGARMQVRARELEDELSRFCADSANRITVSARNFIMSRVFELINLCSDMRADAATERGAALALQGQLAESRREVAGLQRRVLGAERAPVGDILGGLVAPPAVAPAEFPAGPGVRVAGGAGPAVAGVPTYAAVVRAGGPAGVPGVGPVGPAGPVGTAAPGAVPGARHEHVAFLTPVGATETPARDVVRLLKANIDPVANDIRDVTLRHTRYGVTVFTNNAQTITNIKNAVSENAVTRAAMTVRVPARRNPHVRFSGVDPDLGPEEFLRLLDERNPTLRLGADLSNVKVCELHFKPQYLRTTAKYTDPRTGRITEAPMGATRLTPDAVPTIFPNAPSYLSNYAPVREGPDQKKKRLEASHLEEAIRQSIALHEEEEHRNKLSSYEDLVSRLQGLGLSTYWATVKAENAVLFVHISGEDPPVVERSDIVSRNMEITAFWKKVKVPAKDLLIPATLDDLRSLHTILDRMSSFKAPDVCDKEEKVKATFSLLFSLLDDLKSGDLLPQEKTEALDFIKEQLDLLHRKDHSLRYSAELLIFSSILHTISPHAYRFIRGAGKIALPHPSTLMRICSQYNVNPANEQNDEGFLRYVKKRSSLLKPHEKIVTIMMDEIHIQPYFEYKGEMKLSHTQKRRRERFIFSRETLVAMPSASRALARSVKTRDVTAARAIETNSVTRTAVSMRVPERRRPHVKFSGVDPDVAAEDFLRELNARKPTLNLNLETSRVNLDHARLSRDNLCEFMTSNNISMAAVCDPYRPRGRMPRLPEGFFSVACEVDPAAALILRRPPYDVSPLMVTKWVVAICLQTRAFEFVISAYAPPHKPMQHTLGVVEVVVARSS
ncbi:hypothetical protein HPB50_014601 [Hyalomma asiaticum]|uniref:Uncharacterized protein n=1 Tax=Hyalomma asiaticum TaxID=266040 RepID=A0ACB7T710_HYAAI|nr:hypothetical protein HPB50_014601 [Hyalomma asiaticum]